MRTNKYIATFIILCLLSISFASAQTETKPKITFIELGSLKCIPCKKMKPILKSIEKKYGTQVKVIFYDVMKKEHKSLASQFGIKLIPTQIFLDENGREIHRHEGYYPESKIDEFLKLKGLKIINKKN